MSKMLQNTPFSEDHAPNPRERGKGKRRGTERREGKCCVMSVGGMDAHADW